VNGGLVVREFVKPGVRTVRNWVPAHARHYQILGLVMREDRDSMTVAVYGSAEVTMNRGVAVMARRRPLPIPA